MRHMGWSWRDLQDAPAALVTHLIRKLNDEHSKKAGAPPGVAATPRRTVRKR
jgi:hypothetical protein